MMKLALAPLSLALAASASAQLGTNYCTPNPNSTGAPARMAASGSLVVANNLVTLECTDMPQGAFGYFLTSRATGFVANPGGSQGNLCLGGAIGRYVGPGQVQNSGSAQRIELTLDLTQHPTPTGLVPVVTGETWFYQCWFRDGFLQPTSNFSDGLELTYQ